MTVTHGMDAEAGRAAGDAVERGADELEALGARLDVLINGFDWTGVDAERTREQWRSVERPRIARAFGHLAELAVDLRREAADQDVVSGATDTGGVAAPSRASVPVDQGRAFDGLRDRLAAIGAGLRRQGHALADFGGKVLDSLTGERQWSVAAIVSSALGNVGAALGTAANAVTGEDQRWFAESHAEVGSPVPVPLHSVDPTRPGLTAPTDTATLMQGVADAYAAGGAEGSGGDVRITTVTNADGRVGYVVAIPGTEDWSPAARGTVRDLTANLDLMASRPTAAVESVREAMAAAGVPHGAPVLLVGHSQGGIIAGELATDAGFREQYDVSHVLAFGAPVDHLDFDSSTRVLQVQHEHDVVPRLDLGGIRDSVTAPFPEREPVVTLPDPGSATSLVENHSYVQYVDSVNTTLHTGGDTGAAIRQWQDDPGMAVFLVGPEDRASAVDVPIRRGEPR